MKPLYSLLLLIVIFSLIGCGSSGPKTYTEADLPAAVPSQFQGWWKGKSEWDYLSISPDGMLKTVFPQDLQAAFNPALSTPNANSFMKVFRNQGDTLYGISKEQRFERTSGAWTLPVYYYVTLHYDFASHILTYIQQPCNLTEADMDKAPEDHVQKLTHGACTITEDSAGQHLWKRTTTYFRN